jgi:hypothetical protein
VGILTESYISGVGVIVSDVCVSGAELCRSEIFCVLADISCEGVSCAGVS